LLALEDRAQAAFGIEAAKHRREVGGHAKGAR
jgi:hypothetical protein